MRHKEYPEGKPERPTHKLEPLKVKLSERVRPDCEVGRWVYDEIVLLEKELEAEKAKTAEARSCAFVGNGGYCSTLEEERTKVRLLQAPPEGAVYTNKEEAFSEWWAHCDDHTIGREDARKLFYEGFRAGEVLRLK